MFNKIASEIIAKNKEFDYVASKTEIANEIWSSHMNPTQRLEVMNKVDLVGTPLKQLRACVNYVSTLFEV